MIGQSDQDEDAPIVFARRMGLNFRDDSLIRRAFTHRSYLNEHREVMEDNERLEFLGDAVLDFLVGAWLYNHFPEMAEGQLTRLRAALVGNQQLAEFARQIQLGEAILLGKGEVENKGKERLGLLGSTFEAVIGAIYLDQGFRVVDKFIKKNILVTLPDIIASQTYIDAKSRFQEKAQEIKNVTPRYRVLSESGPDHNKKFIIGVYLDKELVADGEGYSKQEAQTAAATKALKIKGW